MPILDACNSADRVALRRTADNKPLMQGENLKMFKVTGIPHEGAFK